MLKHVVYLLIASLLAVLLGHYIAGGLRAVLWLHHELSLLMRVIFSGGHVGLILRDSLAMLMVPCLVAGVVALICYVLRRPIELYTIVTAWAVWLILMTAIWV